MLSLDHILYAVPDLAQGMNDFTERTGVAPQCGGRHPNLGTHNALVGLGEGVYLELIAPDPEAAFAREDIIFGIGQVEEARLLTWAVRCDHFAALHRVMPLQKIQDGSRITSDGEVLSWRTAEFACDFDHAGCMPFVIDWEDSPHPSETSPTGCELQHFAVHHPEPAKFAVLQQQCADTLVVERAPHARLELTITTPRGILSI